MPRQRELRKWENLPTDFLNRVRKYMGEDFFRDLNPKPVLSDLSTTRLWRRIGDWVKSLENGLGIKIDLDVYWGEVPFDINAALIADIFCRTICELYRSAHPNLNLSDQDVYDIRESRPEFEAIFLYNMNSFMVEMLRSTSGIYIKLIKISGSKLPSDGENITRGFKDLLTNDPRLDEVMKNWRIEDKPTD